MAPTAQEFIVGSSRPDPDSLTGNEIVITGISGLFPKSDNVLQFMENLYNHVDMVGPNSPSMSFKHPEMPPFTGAINGYHKFDSNFFKVIYRQAEFMDPMNRKLLEETYSALFDAGINPATLSGGKIGVFVGSSFSDYFTSKLCKADSRYTLTGSSKNMMANRISYWLDGKAPSYAVNQSCSSATTCLEHAYWAIKNGICDAAIIGGANQILEPLLSLNLRRAGCLSLDGKTKCFDKNGDGYVRSEACGTLFLQRAKDAKRIYCEVYHARAKFFMTPKLGISVVRKSEDIEKFLKEFYNEIDVSPEIVEYVEANALGIAEVDRDELKAIANFFAKCKNVKVGSVKSNMGHGEAASGICSMIKVCLANHTGKLPANLHFSEPPDNIQAVQEGRIQFVTENLPFNRGYIALNSFSLGGANVHILLKSLYKKKDLSKYRSSIPRLVCASARTEEGVNKMIDYLKNKPIDPEEVALLHNFYSMDVSGHTARGYVVLTTDKNNKTIGSSESSQHYSGVKRPVWFMYSGMGSQWASMGATLMRIPIFAAAIERCRRVLEPKGVDIIRILTDPDETIFDNILNSFVGISAVQIGLTDVLKALEIIPDNIIGHSVGELGCAYADGCFTAEEMILASYYRGLVSLEANLPKGAMAAIGLGYKNVSPICPPEIDVACHNSSESCTISGPCEDIKKFVAELNGRGVFAREVNTSNIAYHSRYIKQLGDKLRSNMREFITNPKLRSNNWLSTSVLPENWGKTEAQYSSAEYFTNNLLSSVYFEEVATKIPTDAIVIEVAPHGLMQAILKRSHESCVHVPLTKRKHHDGPSFLLDAIGKLYEAGLNPKLDALYPRVMFPVSTETPVLSHLVEWEHSEDWSSTDKKIDDTVYSVREVFLSMHDDDWSFIKDHIREGIAVVPEAAILFLVWETLGIYHGIDYKQLSVSFSNVEFQCAVNAELEDTIKISVNIMIGSGNFEVTWKKIVISTGSIHVNNEKHISQHADILEIEECDIMSLNSRDVYTIMNLRGHSYGHKMQSIDACNMKLNKAQIKWNGDWVILLDSLLQLGALATDHKDIVIPVYINSLVIHTLRHKNQLCDGKYNAVVMGNEDKIIRCGATELKNVVYHLKTTVAKGDDGIALQNATLKVLNNCSHQENNGLQVVKLTSTRFGDFDELNWVKRYGAKGNAPIKVCYAGVSLRDCYKALGSVTECNSFGMDYSGINERYERVMGVVGSGAMATSIEADLDLMWPVPEHWSLEDAATVPLPYLLVYYALTIRSQVEKHHSILILDGATALGQAFISVCLEIDCNVFTTVSNSEKKKLLLSNFPKLKEENTIDCSTNDIKSTIASNNMKYPCDIVVNCGCEVSIEPYLKCVADFGVLLDIIEVPEYKVIGMSNLTAGRNITLVYLPNLFRPQHLEERRILQARISEGISRGIVKPLNRVIYSPRDVSKAFRLFTANGSNGRVLVNMKNVEKTHQAALPTKSTYLEGTHIVINDASGLGIEIVDGLINRGAKNVVLHCQRQSGYLQYKLHSWKNSGVSVSLYSDNLQEEKSCATFIKKTKTNGPVHGIFILEEVISSKTQDYGSFLKGDNNKKECIKSTGSVVDRVDEVSSKLCPELRSFVVVALTSSEDTTERIILERKKTCELRRQKGLPSLVFQMELSNKQTENIEDLLINIRSKELSTMFKSLESAIEHGNDVKFTINNEQLSVDFVKKLTKTLGHLVNFDSDDYKTPLKELDINNLILQEIKALIYTVYGVKYPLENLQQMTIHSLLTLGDCYDNTEVKTGLDALFSYVDADEYTATKPFVTMPTACNKNNVNEETELDSSGTYLLMVPGFEGHHEVFTSLCNTLKIHAVAFQTGSDIQEKNIPEMAGRIMKNIKQVSDLKTKFYLLGYSFGVNIALELASLLEKEGHTGIVFCLDSSPDALKVQMDEYIGNLNEEDLQNSIIKHMYCVFGGKNKDDLDQEIINIHNWAAKVEFCIKKLKCLGNHSHEYIRCTIHGFYDKIKAARDYTPNYKLQSELVLLKGSQFSSEALAEDYGLSEYSAQPVRVFNIEKDFVSIPHDYRVAGIVNKILQATHVSRV